MDSAHLAIHTRRRTGTPHSAGAGGLLPRRLIRRRDDGRVMQGGICCSMYRILGAHPDSVEGVTGTRFAVWAPNATEVSVVCNASGWKPGRNTLQGSDAGIWSGF